MPVEALIFHLNQTFEENAIPGKAAEIATDFLDSDWIARRMHSLGRDILDAFQKKATISRIQNNGKVVTLHSFQSNEIERSLVLQKHFGNQPIIVLDKIRRIYIPFKDVWVKYYKVLGTNKYGPFDLPGNHLTISLVERRLHKRGDLIFIGREDCYIQFEELEEDFLSLVYSDFDHSSTFCLIFDVDSGKFLGTSMIDTTSGKCLSLLDILENFKSDFLPEAAFYLSSHRCPIVRWRALSSLNRTKDPRTEEVLLRYAGDKTPFLAESARKTLAAGKVK
jgi:hypothetical protein